MNDIEKVKAILDKYILEKFDENTDLIEEGLIDSFELIQIVENLEESFQVSIDMGTISRKDFRNVKSIYAFLCKIKQDYEEIRA